MNFVAIWQKRPAGRIGKELAQEAEREGETLPSGKSTKQAKQSQLRSASPFALVRNGNRKGAGKR